MLFKSVVATVAAFFRKEKLLAILIALYAVLTVVDPSFPLRSPKYLDIGSLSIIVSLLLVSRGIELSGIFNRLSVRLLSLTTSPRLLLMSLVLATELTSALVMNDTSLFIFIPFLITLSRISSIDLCHVAILVTIAANVGSSLTPIGNPQNIIIWHCYGPSFEGFVAFMTPFVATATGMLLALAAASASGEKMRVSPPPPVRMDGRLLAASVALLGAVIALAQAGRPLLCLVVTVPVLLALRREIVTTLDYALIAIFAAMFVDFGEVSHLMALYGLTPPSTAPYVILYSAALSQVMSNVPATIALVGRVPDWRPLALGVNIGGTGFLVGSLANIITLRLAGMDLRRFHKYSVPFFTILLAVFTAMAFAGVYP